MENFTYNKGGFYTFPFSAPVIKNTIKVSWTDTGGGGNISNIEYLGEKEKRVGGSTIKICEAIRYYVHLNDYRRIWLTPSVGCGISYYDIAVESTLTANISATTWEEGMADPTGEGDGAGNLPSSVEYQDLKIIVDSGFNLKCVDKYHRDYLGYGEIRAEGAIINGLIPSKEIAERIAKREIFKTGKTAKAITENLPPNFFIIPGVIERSKISSIFLDKNVRVEKIRIAGNGTYEASYNVLNRES